jgi:hypothetical protein
MLNHLRSSDTLVLTAPKTTGVNRGEGDRTKKSANGNGGEYQSPTSRILQYKSSFLPEGIIWPKIRLSGARSLVKPLDREGRATDCPAELKRASPVSNGEIESIWVRLTCSLIHIINSHYWCPPRFTKARPTQKYELGRVAAEMVLQRLNNCRMTPPDDSARCRLKW